MTDKMQSAVAPVLDRQDEDVPPRAVLIDYTNYRGEQSRRLVVPLFLKHEATSWHGQCWTLTALDLEKKSVRSFAMANISGWTELHNG